MMVFFGHWKLTANSPLFHVVCGIWTPENLLSGVGEDDGLALNDHVNDTVTNVTSLNFHHR